jgi:hypothetical protein
MTRGKLVLKTAGQETSRKREVPPAGIFEKEKARGSDLNGGMKTVSVFV